MSQRFKGKADRSRYGKRHKPGEMNKTEAEFADILQARKMAGEIIDFCFEPVSFKLARLCTYTPDFLIYLADGGMEFVDAKGGGPIDDKSIVKIKCAAEKFWMFQFVIEKRRSKKDGGGWERREF